jgi:glyoxylase-like metal-dependent hydrolase (beta-lactamase superfamily II)
MVPCEPAFRPDSTALFPGVLGNTFGSADHARIMDGLQALFDRLPDETWLYPCRGHDTTIGAERPNLPEGQERGWLRTT